MKKILLILLVSTLTLTGCELEEVTIVYNDQDTYYPIEDVLEDIIIENEIENNFELISFKDNVELTWSSLSDAIVIENNFAKVYRTNSDIEATLRVEGKKNNETKTKDFNVTVLKKDESNIPTVNIVTVSEIYETDIDTLVLLESVSVQASYSSGTFFTDGESVVYVYGTSNLTVGDTYELEGTVSSYGSNGYEVKQLTNVELTKIDSDSTYLNPIFKSIEYIQTADEPSFYTTTGTIQYDNSTLLLVDGENKIEVSSYNLSSSLELLKQFNGCSVTIDVYTTGGHTNKTVLTFVEEKDLSVSDLDKVTAVANQLVVTSATMSNITLQTTSTFNTTITWESNKEDILSSSGIVNRQEEDESVELSATIRLNDTLVTKKFVVIVININQVASSNLFISEYYEGKSNDKYIEIYNANTNDVDLSEYSLKIGTNGASFGTTYNLFGTLGGQEAIVVAHTGVSADITTLLTSLNDRGFTNYGVCNFNGDDAIGLFKNDELIDIFGIEGEDPGTSWSVEGGNTVDHRIVRKPGYGANTTWNISEWTATTIAASGDCLDSFGTHIFKEEE